VPTNFIRHGHTNNMKKEMLLATNLTGEDKKTHIILHIHCIKVMLPDNYYS